ncbi:uncharacterized protein BDW70DRAFT_162981 [Aspergillus foveolatus]|uniref:uncharacterized protein n=1 Tax=Aspergillus foveolatus TaxID=210207 RepID=UPI003CCE52D7
MPFAPPPAEAKFKVETMGGPAMPVALPLPNLPPPPALAPALTPALMKPKTRFFVSAADPLNCSPPSRGLNNWKQSIEYRDIELLPLAFSHVTEDGSFNVVLEVQDADAELTAKLVVLADYYYCLELLAPFYAAEPTDIIRSSLVAFAGSEKLRNKMLHLSLCWAFG